MKKKLLFVATVALGCAGCTAPSSNLANLHANAAINYGGLYGPVKIVVLAPTPGQSASYDFKNDVYTVTWNTNLALPSAYATTNALNLPVGGNP